jgi:predicted  nucleic acid-binding Zn-ribbon protein
MLDRVIGLRRRRAREEKAQGASEAADPIRALEQRVTHLESMIEGLQDAVHRSSQRTEEQLDELHRRTEPAELSRALSRHARERGL